MRRPLAERLGFMQGRLSPMVEGRIQCFPWAHWRDEFVEAQAHSWHLMEWTLDFARIDENPLMCVEGREEIRALSSRHGLAIPSLTGDFFMQRPFFASAGRERMRLLELVFRVFDACLEIGVGIAVLPLVDNSSVTPGLREDLLDGLSDIANRYRHAEISVALESDYSPAALRALMDELPPEMFGVNYDMGNSAALGFDALEEWNAYGSRICNVHVKDRPRGGTTVPLGEGDAAIHAMTGYLETGGYEGNYIFQTARATDGADAEWLDRFRDYLIAGQGPR